MSRVWSQHDVILRQRCIICLTYIYKCNINFELDTKPTASHMETKLREERKELVPDKRVFPRPNGSALSLINKVYHFNLENLKMPCFLWNFQVKLLRRQ